MISKFEITDIHKSGAVLDPIKLDWMNGEYIKRMELGELHSRIVKYLEEYENEFYTHIFSQKNYDFNTKIIRELQTRMKRFDEFVELSKFFYNEVSIRPELMMNPKMKIESIDMGYEALEFVLPFIENGDYTSLDTLKEPIL